MGGAVPCVLRWVTLAVTAVIVAGCAGFQEPESAAVYIEPEDVVLGLGEQIQFTARIENSELRALRWGVRGDDSGTITSNGLYTAPQRTGVFTVWTQIIGSTGTNGVDTEGTTTVTVIPSTPVRLLGIPETIELGTVTGHQFTWTVTGTTNQTVTWTMPRDDYFSTLTDEGYYIAPAQAGTYQVTATSAADPRQSVTCTITVVKRVTLTLTPAETTVAPGGTVQYQWEVTGTDKPSVTWFVYSGTIGPYGTYTAPTTPGTYSVFCSVAAELGADKEAIVHVVAPTGDVGININ